jgi:membrane-bound ClpP family serine protease
MPFTCNIDAKGKRYRFVQGVILTLIGLILIILWAFRAGDALSWATSLACLLIGLFCIFEARAGWCALRAMGIKTKL